MMNQRFFTIIALTSLLLVTACHAEDGRGEGSSADDDAGTQDDDADNSPAAPVQPVLALSDSTLQAGQRDCEPIVPASYPNADIEDPSVVSFDEQLFFTVDGNRFFPIGFYDAPTDAAGLAAYRSEGFNIALTGPGCCGGTSLQDQMDLLSRGRDASVFLILHPWWDPNDVLNRPEDDLAAELAARTGYGSLFGWYTFDEPGLWAVPKALTSRMHQVLGTHDPAHLDGLVEDDINDYSLYVDDCAFFMIDPYPSPIVPLSYVKASIEEALVATAGTKPLVGVPQAFSWNVMLGNEGLPFRPTGDEMRNMTWQFIIMGGKGLVYFIYSGAYSIRQQPEVWTPFLETVAEINALAGVILTDDANDQLDPESDYPDLFLYSVKRTADASWVFSASLRDRRMDVTLHLSPLGLGRCVVDYSTGETFVQDDQGDIRVRYAANQVRILQVQ